MKSKKGLVGSFTVNYVVTIIVIVLLVLFIIGAGAVKAFTEKKGEAIILDEEDVGINDVVLYMEDAYLKRVMERVGIISEGGLNG